MELVSFSVENFRSITKAYKLPIRRPTVLIGPNNEGKSNILRALVTALQFLSTLGGVRLRNDRIALRRSQELYDWERDFPMSLQESEPDGKTIFDLAFRLNDVEVSEFYEAVRSDLNGTLPIQLIFGAGETRLRVTKKGPGGKALTKKAEHIARFVAGHIHIAYIPAVRTAQSAYSIVTDLVGRELASVERSEEYQKALGAVAALQKPVLDRIAVTIAETLKEFLPGVKGVQVQIPDEARYRALRRACEIMIDDGTATLLDAKGDGVQSLAALSLMKQTSQSPSSGRELLLAIEEPESHLHPRAIHQLRGVLADLGREHQVILTTHCPLFVDRANLRSNILVNKQKAIPAKNIADVRDVLGVRASDNLRNAELVLIVEGEDDRIEIGALLSASSKTIQAGFQTGIIAIDSLAGGSNLAYKLSQLRDSLCLCHSFLDDDNTGRMASEKAQAEGLLEIADISLAVCPGRVESEFEDLLSTDLYRDMILNRYGVSLSSPKFGGNRKWSDRLKATFAHQGKPWSAKVESKIKSEIAELVISSPTTALNDHTRGPIDALRNALESKLGTLEKNRKSK